MTLRHGEIFHVGEPLGRVILGVQHHQLVTKLLGLGWAPSFMVTKKGKLLRVETTHGQCLIGGLGGTQHGHDGGSEQGIELFHHFIPCVCLLAFVIDHHGEQNDAGLGDHLVIGGYVEQVEGVVEEADDQGTDQGHQMREASARRPRRFGAGGKIRLPGQLVAGIAHEINTPLGIGLTAATHLTERTRGFQSLSESGGLKRSDLSSFLQTVAEGAEIITANLGRAAEISGIVSNRSPPIKPAPGAAALALGN